MCEATDGDVSPKPILMIYGTEMGSTKVEAKNILDAWEKDGVPVELVEGDDAADAFDGLTPEKYRLVVVLTSSYGDGDPPSGYGKFLYQLYARARAGATPLAGLEHAVLGFGSTTYDTFQNVPRLTDRLLGELGSRRFLRRVEVDEMEDLQANQAAVRGWSDAVKAHHQTAPQKGPAVCAWTEPAGEVFEKRMGPDGYELAPEQGKAAAPVVAVAVAAAAFAYYRYYVM